MTTTTRSRFIPNHSHLAALAPLALAVAIAGCGKKDNGTGGMAADPPAAGSAESKLDPDPPTPEKAAADEHTTYAALDVGADYATWDKLNSKPVKSKTHGGRFVDTYVNKIGVEAYKNDDADIPVGTIIIKTSWEAEGDKPTEVAGPIFIMKRVAGEGGGEASWWYGLHWEKIPEKWQKGMGGAQAYWRTPAAKVGYCSKCHDNFPRELGGVPKGSRAYQAIDMTVWLSTILGIAFLGLAFLSTYLMFQYWGYPYDKEKKKSECPQWKMNIHRGVGYAYGLIYLLMMIKMVPRMWTYQVEFAPRTVAHIMLGMSIGVILIIKLSILRWFRHFEEWMPKLGVALLFCTVLLIGLSVPNVLRERALASGGPGGSAFSAENRSRVEKLLPGAGLPDGTDIKKLASEKSLRRGRRVLLKDCVYCHDLKTSIARSRSPKDWYRTVERMRSKPSLGGEITDDETLSVTAYLIAITPNLQRSQKAKRQGQSANRQTRAALAEMRIDAGPAPVVEGDGGPTPTPAPPKVAVDMAKAKILYEEECALCHALSDVTDAPPTSIKEVDAMIARMIDNGLDLESGDLAQIRAYMIATFAK